MVVHPAAGHSEGTLVNALLAHCKDDLSDINGVLRPGIVHRIDKDTSGLMLACKNNFTHLKLADMLSRHEIVREYRALVYGYVKEDKGMIDAPIYPYLLKPEEIKQLYTPYGRELLDLTE